MSGIAGAAVQPEHAGRGEWLAQTVDRLLAALSHYGGVSLPPDGLPSTVLNKARGTGVGARWADSSCALGIQWLAQTPEAMHEVQPLRDEASGCVLVWDGRLDNREELAEWLGTHSHELADSALALGAFLRWREACAARLLGDFAFAVWDPRERFLYAARDPMGVRPFFYHAGAEGLCFASEFQALFRLAHVPREPDEVMAGEALLWWTSFADVQRTFYRDVRRLPPAHWLRWDANGFHLERYWDIDPQRSVRYTRRSDYAEHYGELLRQAVACRMRAARGVAVMLSGGLDSAAVTTVAAHLDGHDRLRAYNLRLVDDPNDESGLAERVAREAGVPFRALPLPEGNVLPELEPYLRLLGVPFADLSLCSDLRVLHLAATEGCLVMFTGDGNDELFNFLWAYVADLVLTFRWKKLTRDLPSLARYNTRTSAYLLKHAAPFFAPRPLVHLWKRVRWHGAPRWINPEFARRSALVDRLRAVPTWHGFSSLSANVDYWSLMRGRRVLIDETRNGYAARLGMEFRFPFYDRRMLEFMFAVPWEEKIEGWRNKVFLRDAPCALPEPMRSLDRKANYSPCQERQGKNQDWRSLRPLFEVPPRLAEGYVYLPEARDICRKFLNGDRSRQDTFFTLVLFLIWLKQFD